MLTGTKFESCIILDWYDGIVKSLAKHESAKKWYYCSLLAWVPGRQERIFSLYEINAEHFNNIMKFLNTDEMASPVWIPESKDVLEWDKLYLYLNDKIVGERRPEHLVSTSDLIGEGMANVTIDFTTAPYFMEIDDVLEQEENQINDWYDLLLSN